MRRSTAWYWTRGLALTAVSVAGLAVSPGFAQIPTIPPEFGVSDRVTILIAHAEGAQVYECGEFRANWTLHFREPIATLIVNGQTIGRHYAGPNWELTDGSRVKGKVAATAAGATPEDIPLLKLDVVEHSGDGQLKDATTVLRLNTHGGVLSGRCPTFGALVSVPYSADYVFLR